MLKKNLQSILTLVLVLIVLSLPLFKAQAGTVEDILPNPLKADSFKELFVLIANWVVSIVGLVAILMIMIGGFQFMMAGGNEESVKSAKRTIFWSVIGLIIALASWSLLRELLKILGVVG